MYNSKTISVVIPCYNEQEGLDRILRSKPPFIDEIIVVDNNSSDNTANVARKYAAILIHEKKRGYGHAYLSGLPKATGDIIVTLDGDDSYPVLEIEKLLSHMENTRCDFVSGCRFPLIDKDAQPVINRLANRAISLLIRTLFRVDIKDSQSGMMAFKKGLLDSIQPSNTSMGFSQEIKIKAWTKNNLRCGEVRIGYRKRLGEVKFRKVANSVENICSIFVLFFEIFILQKAASR